MSFMLYFCGNTKYFFAPLYWVYTIKFSDKTIMSLLRVLLSIFFPPLAVVDKGCGSFLIVFLLTLCGWVPGVIGALVILNKD